MKKSFLLFLLCTVLLSVNAQKKKAAPLFNGKDLTGWKIHGTEKWYVDHGELVDKLHWVCACVQWLACSSHVCPTCHPDRRFIWILR